MSGAAAPTDGAGGEVVTRALLRYVELPGGPGRLALITLDNGILDNGADHTRPNTLGPAGLAGLADVLDRVASSDAVAVAVTGKPYSFAAGADLRLVPRISNRAEALEVGRLGHAVFRRFAELARPSFAYVNGVALGGGLELALHATFRTVSAGAPALGLPEVSLGLVPGWGGSYLLPRLIGTDRAVTVMLANPLDNNRTLSGPQAFSLGVADALFEPADFLERSLEWTGAVLRGDIDVPRPVDPTGGSPAGDAAEWDAAVARGRTLADAKVHGAAPAPYRALELLAQARTATRDAAFAAEDEALADLLLSDELRAGLYAFDLVRKRARRPAGAPDPALARPVTSVGIVGAGLMASQLALLFARRLRVPVVMTDLDRVRVERGIGYVHGEVDKLAAKRRITADEANRLRGLVSGGVDKAAFGDCDLVLEAVFEDMSVKQAVFAELEGVVKPDCLLATNTSSLSVTRMASRLERPDRLVGCHFFNPVAVLPLLEVVRGERTDDAALATAFAVARSLKKSAVLVRDAPAFVVNRLLARFLSEVTRAVDEGTPIPVAESALAPLGLPMSPFALLQLVGPAVALHVADTLHAVYPERFHVSENLRRLVTAGRHGFFVSGPDGTPTLDPEVLALLRVGDTPLDAAALRTRVLDALAEEIRLLLDDGVVADPRDVDLCMILGAGWPFHLGGITPYLDRTGSAQRVTGTTFLPPGVANVPRPPAPGGM